MGSISKHSLKDQTYQLIKSRILNQEYQCGEKININSLSRELGVSNTPIREAISILEKEGLITTSPFSVPCVVKFNNELFRETWDSVQILLLGCYEYCVSQNRISELLSLMSESVDHQREIFQKADNITFARATIAVDTTLVETCQNSHLFSIYNSTFDIQCLMLVHDYQTNRVDRLENIREHDIILNAISARQHDSVRSLLKQHYDRCISFS